MKKPAFVAIVAAVVLLAACSQPAKTSSSSDAAATSEEAALAPLKTRYKDLVTGIEAKGTTFIVYVDVNNLYSMDEPVEDQLKREALERWTTAWRAAHPHKHAKLRVSLHDYYGTDVFSETASV